MAITLNGSTGLTANDGSVFTNASGNVGIGTGSPSYRLDVSASVNSNFVARVINNSGATSSDNALLVETSTASGARIISARNAGTERFYVAGNGDVGVINTFFMNSGYGSAAVAYGCRAWVNFNGTGTPAIRASGNVSSITDNGTGLFTANFTTAMPDGNYTSNITTRYTGSGDTLMSCIQGTSYSTSSISARIMNSSFNLADPTEVSISVFR